MEFPLLPFAEDIISSILWKIYSLSGYELVEDL
jgi:hypothetical protein